MAFKSPVDLANNIVEPSLRERWNKYLKYGMRGTNPDKWNVEIQEIEKMLPFKDDAEHKLWLDRGTAWKGEPEWLDQTNELIDRYERNK